MPQFTKKQSLWVALFFIFPINKFKLNTVTNLKFFCNHTFAFYSVEQGSFALCLHNTIIIVIPLFFWVVKKYLNTFIKGQFTEAD